MNIVIIEDEAPALARIRKLVKEVDYTINILATADSIESAVVVFEKYGQIDFALMDIELADGQSFEVFNRVTVKCPVIFTTAYDEFALKAFKVNSIDYLLKPIDVEDLKRAISKLKVLRSAQVVPDYKTELQTLLAGFKAESTSYKSRFLIKTGTRLISVPVEQIAYFQAADKLVYAYTDQGNKHIIDYTLEELMKALDPLIFFQLNRQFVANVKSIQSVHTYFNGKLKLELKPSFAEEVIVSRERAGEFKHWLDS
ncbi:MAG: LytTR family DNA-binding domain-containing protein [Bacteroidota bacterium]